MPVSMPACCKARLYVAHHCVDAAAFALQHTAFALTALSTNASVLATLQGSSDKDTRIVSYLSACICSSRRPSAVYNTILTRLRSEPLTSPHRHPPSPHHQQQQQQRDQERLAPSPSLPVQQQLQQLHADRQAHQQLAPAAQQHPVSTSLVDTKQNASGQVAQGVLKGVTTLGDPPPVARAAVVPEAEPDMSGQQALISMAAFLEGLAVEFDGKGQVQKGLSVRLLALQLLIVALQRGDASLEQPSQGQPVLHAQQQHEATPGTSKLPQQQDQDQLPVAKTSDGAHTEEALQPEHIVSKKEMRQMLVDMASKVEEGVKTLRGKEEETLVPYVWQVVYEAALDFARTAAMQEVIGELGACILPYSQVC